MSAINRAARKVPPRWMPIGNESELCSAGEWWDVIRVTEAVGRRAIAILRGELVSIGAVFFQPDGPEPRLYFLVPVGVAAHWNEPETVSLGRNCHVVVPQASALAPPGLHWHVFPANARGLTDPEGLRKALGKARRERQGPSE
ncbi:hypothetical protein YWIDRAFT_07710 [Streptomyces sp. SceaMP-e96]|nr:hypothetical protein YWIDRAFT_07710 [Streptomyces sp. SceaMP-e96]